MPRKRLRTKMLSPRRCKTCEHGERASLELKSPVVQPKANRRASEAVPAPTHFERMEVRTLRCAGTSGYELDEGDTWAPTLGFPYCANGTWDSLRKETSRGTESSESSELGKAQHVAKGDRTGSI
jgi:hypothetical protein